MEYLDFLAKVNSDDPELYIPRGEDETPYPRGYFDNVIEKLDYIERHSFCEYRRQRGCRG